MNFDLKLYWKLLLRRLPVMLLLFTLATLFSVVLAARLPDSFRTSARLLVQDAQIPDELAPATVRTTANEEIEIIRQQLLTRANLLDIARSQNVFADYSRQAPDEIVENMRKATNIDTRGGQRDAPSLINVAFEARSGAIAANVVNEYVTRIVNASVENRTGRAQNTLDFFQQEVERLDGELTIRSDRITEFQNEHAGELPADLDFRLNRQTLLQERVANANREKASLQEQRERVTTAFEENGTLPGAKASPQQQQLRDLEAQLNNSLAVFSETNPRIVSLRARIDQLRERINESPDPATGGTPTESLLDLQLAQIDGQIENIDATVAQAESELADLEESIAATPKNASVLQGLQRDYQNTRNQYDRAVERLAQANTGERIEVTSRGQKITLIESANVPNEPSSPNRPLLVATGAAVGAGLAAAFFLLLELLNRTIRTQGELTHSLQIVPLITLPYLESTGRRLFRRGLQIASLLLVLAGVPALLWAVDTYYLPLDLLAEKVMERVGLT